MVFCVGLGLVIGSGVLHQSHHDDSSHQVGEGVFDEDDGTADFLLNPDVEEDDGDAVGNSDRVRPQFPPTVPLKPNPKDVAKERNHKAGLERGDKQVESERRQKPHRANRDTQDETEIAEIPQRDNRDISGDIDRYHIGIRQIPPRERARQERREREQR